MARTVGGRRNGIAHATDFLQRHLLVGGSGHQLQLEIKIAAIGTCPAADELHGVALHAFLQVGRFTDKRHRHAVDAYQLGLVPHLIII